MQTYARVALPPSTTRTRWRFGSNRRFVATMEWLRWLPKPGFFPQIAQTLDIRRLRIADEWCLPGLGLLANLGEQVGHLERGPCGVRALLDPRFRLLGRVHREDAERDRNAGLEAGELEPRGRRSRGRPAP